MRRKIRGRILWAGALVCMALISQPVLALCGNCARYNDILGCYASTTSNNYCITLKCEFQDPEITLPQNGICCYDEMYCSI